jgi:hypothetical protein
VREPVAVRATVLDVQVDPYLRDPLRRHLVRLRIDDVLAGELPTGDVTLLVHSPSKTFQDPDPVGSTFLVTLTPPIGDPYAGPVDIVSADPE